jgi:hypothetical protein
MANPRRELQLVAANLALVLTGCYVLAAGVIVFGGLRHNDPTPAWVYTAVLVPLGVFIPATMAAIGVHRSSDPAGSVGLWARALGLAIGGWLPLIVVAIVRS